MKFSFFLLSVAVLMFRWFQSIPRRIACQCVSFRQLQPRTQLLFELAGNFSGSTRSSPGQQLQEAELCSGWS